MTTLTPASPAETSPHGAATAAGPGPVAFAEELPELRWTSAASPAGEVVVVYSPEDDTVRASGLAVARDGEPPVAAIGRLLEELMDRLEAVSPQTAAREMNPLPAQRGAVVEALTDYVSGDVGALTRLTVDQPGTPYRAEVWTALRDVTPGDPVTYTELAERSGRATAVRAAASACAQNLCAVVVPCHRVVRSDGSVGKYLFGSEAKRALLDFEAAHAGS